MAKKVVMVLFKVLSQRLHGGTEESQDNFSQDSQSVGWDLNPGLLNTKQECANHPTVIFGEQVYN
jgi:hypothetical protein